MSLIKLTITNILKFIFLIILIFGLVNLALIYQFGVDSKFSLETEIKNFEFPLTILQALNNFSSLQIKEYVTETDSLNMNNYLTRFNDLLKNLHDNLLLLDSMAIAPEEVEQVKVLNTNYLKYQSLYNTLSSDLNNGATPTYNLVEQQFERLGIKIEDIYLTSWKVIMARLYQNEIMNKNILNIIFLITGLSLLLMLSSGFYSTRIIKQSEKKLSNAYEIRDREKRQFIRYLSHELKTTVSAINLSTNMLNDKRSGRLTKNQKELIQTIEKQSKRLIKMVNETRHHSTKNR